MSTELATDILEKYISDLKNWDAFETSVITNPDGSQDILIPYVMNDAVECVIRLKDGKDTGYEDQYLYSKALFECNCYQYHRIGHNWRTQRREEHLRRLVNLLCVIHDKHNYLGEQACNEVEEHLWPLIEFAPLCYWSPINDSIESWYPETQTGMQEMLELSIAAGDENYAGLIQDYMKLEDSDPSKRWHTISLAKQLTGSEHADLFYYLDDKIKEASILWPPRKYPSEKEKQMEDMRIQVTEKWKKKGYEGTYPLLKKNDPATDGPQQIFFVEEHPFTILEAEDFDFQIHIVDSLP